MREKQIERKLVNAVKAASGIAPKFVSPGYDGMPDRLLLFPGGRMAFVEVKALGGRLRLLQTARHRMLRKLGFKVYILDAETDIEKIVKEVMPDEVHTT